MMSYDHIIDVTEADFEFEVLNYSKNTVVLVDFWATWCQPCKILSPTLEKLAREANGSFRLAKVDVDHNPNLALQFNIRSIPTIKAFSQGQVVGEFLGAQPEQRIKDFIARIKPPSPLDLEVEKGFSLLAPRSWKEAEETFLLVIEQNPDHDQALYGLTKALLAQGKAHLAKQTIKQMRSMKYQSKAHNLLPLADSMLSYQNDKLPEENDLDFAYINCIRLVLRGNIPAALDGLLDILKQDKHYQNDLARTTFLAILDLFGEENSTSREYRTELASVLF